MKFDSYCKKTIKGEVKHYWRELTRQKSKESLFSELTRQELEQLYSMDDYCFDRRYFPVEYSCARVPLFRRRQRL